MNNLAKSEKRMETTRQEPRDRRVDQKENGFERGFVLPPVNITETKDGYMLEAEMPGVNKEGLEVLLEGNELTLIGRRGEHESAECVYRESSPLDYRRVFVLDPSVDTAQIDARMENGVLKLYLPKAEKVKPRRIAIAD